MIKMKTSGNLTGKDPNFSLARPLDRPDIWNYQGFCDHFNEESPTWKLSLLDQDRGELTGSQTSPKEELAKGLASILAYGEMPKEAQDRLLKVESYSRYSCCKSIPSSLRTNMGKRPLSKQSP